ncbi:MAG TPA: transglutaminase domain-containing protein [Candidatus Methanomethylophilaceae archaeon]|nr:transglutaminase domain-containing protein [Candidatus Methanomethylophilaceae archaeon]
MGFGTWVKVIVVGLVCIGMLGFASSPAFQEAIWDGIRERVPIDEIIDDFSGDEDYVFPEYAYLTLNRTITVTADTAVNDLTIRLTLPEEIESLQTVNSLANYTNEPDVQFGSLPNEGGDWCTAHLEVLEEGESVSVSFVYNVTAFMKWWPNAQEDSGNVSDMPPWTGVYMGNMLWELNETEVGYVPEDSVIEDLAQSIVGDEQNVYEILRSVFHWMHDNISYSTDSSSLKTVDQTLQDLEGDCDDQSLLFISLARAAGVPAWMQMGTLYDQQNNRWEHHAWVQTYIPGVGNVTIDPANNWFLINAPDRITTFTDQGNATLMENFYNYICFYGRVEVTDECIPQGYYPSSDMIEVPASHTRW